MLVDAFQTLQADGFDVRAYQYTGFGSVYFVDFVLFHKYLGIDRMWNIEHDRSIARRVRFNKPFRFVRTFMRDAGEVITRLSKADHHILWLDYDDILASTVAEHIYLAASRLSAGSVLMVTVDIEPPVEGGTPREWRRYFLSEVGKYIPGGSKFGASNLFRVNTDAIENVIRSATSVRDGLEFQPMFAFVYSDGHEMLTVGGMIAGEAEAKLLAVSRLRDRPYARFSWSDEPCRIAVPRLSRKERLFLEGQMPCSDGWVPSAFELSATDVSAYRDIYRFYPVYAELFL